MPTDIFRGPGAPLAKSGFKVHRITSVREADVLEMKFNRWLEEHQLIEIHSVTEITEYGSFYSSGAKPGVRSWSLLFLYKILSMDPEPDICLKVKIVDSTADDEKLVEKIQYFIDNENPIEILHQLRLTWGDNYVAFLMIYKKRR